MPHCFLWKHLGQKTGPLIFDKYFTFLHFYILHVFQSYGVCDGLQRSVVNEKKLQITRLPPNKKLFVTFCKIAMHENLQNHPNYFCHTSQYWCVIVTAVIQKSSRAILLMCGISVGKYAFLVIGCSISFVQAVTSIVVWSAISHITNNCTAVHPNSNLPDLPHHHHHPYHHNQHNHFSHHPRHPHQLSLFRWKAMWTGH